MKDGNMQWSETEPMDDRITPTTSTFGLFDLSTDRLIDGPTTGQATEQTAASPDQQLPTAVLLVDAFADALRLSDADVRRPVEDALHRLGPAIADGLRASADRVAASAMHRRSILDVADVLSERGTGSSITDLPARAGLADAVLDALTAMLLSGDDSLATRTAVVIRRGFPQLVPQLVREAAIARSKPERRVRLLLAVLRVGLPLGVDDWTTVFGMKGDRDPVVRFTAWSVLTRLGHARRSGESEGMAADHVSKPV